MTLAMPSESGCFQLGPLSYPTATDNSGGWLVILSRSYYPFSCLFTNLLNLNVVIKQLIHDYHDMYAVFTPRDLRSLIVQHTKHLIAKRQSETPIFFRC
jgi:hypothetical protein